MSLFRIVILTLVFALNSSTATDAGGRAPLRRPAEFSTERPGRDVTIEQRGVETEAQRQQREEEQKKYKNYPYCDPQVDWTCGMRQAR